MILKQGLTQLNQSLPAAVYVPFIETRNHAILNLVIEETKLFITKERAPFCVVCEVWRPAHEVTVQNKLIKHAQATNNAQDIQSS
jgi:phosphatidylinositol 4-kinase B